MKIIGGEYHGGNDNPEICERCGSPIATAVWVQDDAGNIHIYGTTCARRMVGDAEVERVTREAMERHERERAERQRRIAQKPNLERAEMMRRAGELNKTDPMAALRLIYQAETQ